MNSEFFLEIFLFILFLSQKTEVAVSKVAIKYLLQLLKPVRIFKRLCSKGFENSDFVVSNVDYLASRAFTSIVWHLAINSSIVILPETKASVQYLSKLLFASSFVRMFVTSRADFRARMSPTIG